MEQRKALRELKRMSAGRLREHWQNARFPFDLALGCSHCLTQHATHGCNVATHAPLVRAVLELDANFNGQMTFDNALRASLERLYILRLQHNNLYPTPEELRKAPETVTPVEAKQEQEVEYEEQCA
jgi:hypothetical protein